MSDADVAEILGLPVEEKLRLVELLWESLSAAPSDLPLTDAQRAAVDNELVNHRRSPNHVLTLEQVLSEIPRAR